jgi:hypothetical protein
MYEILFLRQELQIWLCEALGLYPTYSTRSDSWLTSSSDDDDDDDDDDGGGGGAQTF